MALAGRNIPLRSIIALVFLDLPVFIVWLGLWYFNTIAGVTVQWRPSSSEPASCALTAINDSTFDNIHASDKRHPEKTFLQGAPKTIIGLY